MNYYIDTEFLEGPQTKRFLGINAGVTKPTIDLISVGIVSEDGREYYAISKDFNLKEAWNRHDLEYQIVDFGRSKQNVKVYWIRENVLRPIYEELRNKALKCESVKDALFIEKNFFLSGTGFSFAHLEALINHYGKTNKQIAREIVLFSSGGYISNDHPNGRPNPVFHAYYADYDWVAFCWLFGRMMDLPKGFPMYCIDLKQLLDDKARIYCRQEIEAMGFDYALNRLKEKHPNYPKQENEHNALADAKWNKKLHKFINGL